MVATRHSLPTKPDPDGENESGQKPYSKKQLAALRKLNIDAHDSLLDGGGKGRHAGGDEGQGGGQKRRVYHYRGSVYEIVGDEPAEWLEQEPERYKKRRRTEGGEDIAGSNGGALALGAAARDAGKSAGATTQGRTRRRATCGASRDATTPSLRSKSSTFTLGKKAHALTTTSASSTSPQRQRHPNMARTKTYAYPPAKPVKGWAYEPIVNTTAPATRHTKPSIPDSETDSSESESESESISSGDEDEDGDEEIPYNPYAHDYACVGRPLSPTDPAARAAIRRGAQKAVGEYIARLTSQPALDHRSSQPPPHHPHRPDPARAATTEVLNLAAINSHIQALAVAHRELRREWEELVAPVRARREAEAREAGEQLRGEEAAAAAAAAAGAAAGGAAGVGREGRKGEEVASRVPEIPDSDEERKFDTRHDPTSRRGEHGKSSRRGRDDTGDGPAPPSTTTGRRPRGVSGALPSASSRTGSRPASQPADHSHQNRVRSSKSGTKPWILDMAALREEGRAEGDLRWGSGTGTGNGNGSGSRARGGSGGGSGGRSDRTANAATSGVSSRPGREGREGRNGTRARGWGREGELEKDFERETPRAKRRRVEEELAVVRGWARVE